MIIIADSGSTKTDWTFIKNHQVLFRFSGRGLNPYFADDAVFEQAFAKDFPAEADTSDVHSVFFYGSGCASNIMEQRVSTCFRQNFPNARIFVGSDLLGAARALFRSEKGIVCILGTGSSNAVYDGSGIVKALPSLGYILGDEGSGAALGKRLLHAFFYEELDNEISEKLKNECSISRNMVLKNVYQTPGANTWLASLVPFVYKYKSNACIAAIVKTEINLLFQYQLRRYDEFALLPLAFTGSVAFLFKEILMETAGQYGINPLMILQKPIEGLIEYHANL